jgi:hypothetical protein
MPRSVEFENGDEANFGGRDIDGILKGDFVPASDAELNGAHSGGIDVSPTNTGDGVWRNGMQTFEIAANRGNVNCCTSVQDEGGRINVTSGNMRSRVGDRHSGAIIKIHRFAEFCPVHGGVGRAIDSIVSLVRVISISGE